MTTLLQLLKKKNSGIHVELVVGVAKCKVASDNERIMMESDLLIA